MVHAHELSHENGFICPLCGFPLSLLRRTIKETGVLAILVTCEGCDDYNGFVIGLMDADCLTDYSDYNKEEFIALIEGYEWKEK